MTLLVQIASYNTNLQGDNGLPQDLVDWLSPTLQVSTFLSHQSPADIVAVGFQELLPLHLGLSGLSKKVLDNRNAHILEQIEANSNNKERYVLIAKVVNAGVALLVYARDAGVARTACDVHTTWTGSGPGYMANKGAVGVRFRVPGPNGGPGETFTFVCAHLTAHAEKFANRLADWHHIVGSLLFPAPGGAPTTLYETSHLFLLGDLNFRVVLPPEHPLKGAPTAIGQALSSQGARDALKEYDQLLRERRDPASRAFVGLREGAFWNFKCSYKYHLGEVDKYSEKRTPSWTDRILYTTYTDSPDTPDESAITNLLYTSVPGYTTSDHKPIVSLLLLPAPPPAAAPPSAPPVLRLPAHYRPTPDPHAALKRYTGRVLDRVIGRIWWLLALLGAGNALVGIFNFVLGLGAWGWWRSSGIKLTGGGDAAAV
ncbi:Endonuclease/exonuclease/phosphatase [Mycena epipterygia]|nr:Endonuclease/exonuclease/phosphatase [Mycena epipterygia]